jgi:hypothetical protein
VREIRREQVAVPGAKALAWVGGQLYDVVAGWRSIPVDGSAGSRRFSGYGQGHAKFTFCDHRYIE